MTKSIQNRIKSHKTIDLTIHSGLNWQQLLFLNAILSYRGSFAIHRQKSPLFIGFNRHDVIRFQFTWLSAENRHDECGQTTTDFRFNVTAAIAVIVSPARAWGQRRLLIWLSQKQHKDLIPDATHWPLCGHDCFWKRLKYPFCPKWWEWNEKRRLCILHGGE